MNDERLYTTGEFAKMAGVTIRTIRYYDNKGILKASHHNELGYRLYSNNDFIKLKKILALKYLGLSLDEVMGIELQSFEKDDIANSFNLQKNIIRNKINHMKTVLNIMEVAESSIKNDECINWEKTINIIKMLENENQLLQQYIDSSNLNANVKLQDKFGSNQKGWYNWVFNKLKFKKNYKVLEIGCGNGALWFKNINSLKKSVNITLTDICQDMIDDANYNLRDYDHKFNFKRIDPSDMPFKDESFDVVIANHVLFYMKDLDKVLFEIKRVLKTEGQFYCSTIDDKHMKELEEIMIGFNSNMKISEEKLCENFGLNNGECILKDYFSDIQTYSYKDKLIVNDTKAILEYVYTIPGNILEIVDTKKKEFENYIDEHIKKNKEIHITNSHVLFKSTKTEL